MRKEKNVHSVKQFFTAQGAGGKQACGQMLVRFAGGTARCIFMQDGNDGACFFKTLRPGRKCFVQLQTKGGIEILPQMA